MSLYFKIAIALSILTLSGLAYSQTLLGNCGVGKITGIRVLSDFSINVYCVNPPTSCGDTLDFSVACNSQYIPLF